MDWRPQRDVHCRKQQQQQQPTAATVEAEMDAMRQQRRAPGKAARFVGILAAIGGSWGGLQAGAWAQSSVLVEPEAAQLFAGVAIDSPRALDVDPASGAVLVGSFAFTGGSNALLRLDASGRELARLPLPSPVLAAALDSRDGQLYFTSGGTGGEPARVRRVAASFTAESAVEDVARIPDLPAPPARSAMSLDGSRISIAFEDRGGSITFGLRFRARDGALFISDGLQGAVLRIDDPSRSGNTCPTDSACVQTVLQDGRLVASDGQVGANGLAFSADEATLFVANSGDGIIFALPIAAGGPLRMFADGINFPDGLLAGPNNTLIATATRANEVLVLDATTGQVRARLGAFLGLTAAGAPVGLLDPAQAVRVDDGLIVTNFANPLRTPGVRSFTISRIALPPALLGPAGTTTPGN